MAMQDQPLLCWRNLLAGASYTVIAGTEVAGYEADRMANNDTLRGCRMTADSNGDVIVDFATASGYGYGSIPYGFGPWGGNWPIDAIVLGANRHQSAGWRTPGLTWTVAGEQITDIWPQSTAVIVRPAAPIVPGTTIRVQISGAAAGQQVTIPELYAGPALAMPYLDLGYDPYNEVTSAGAFRAESGREYLAVRYRRLELSPRWSAVTPDLWAMLDMVREDTFEARLPLWFAWAPASHPTEVYLMRHAQPSATLPYRSATHRSLSLKLVESI